MDDLDKGGNYTVRDIGLADKGALLVDWARARMPVLAKLCLLYTSDAADE